LERRGRGQSRRANIGTDQADGVNIGGKKGKGEISENRRVGRWAGASFLEDTRLEKKLDQENYVGGAQPLDRFPTRRSRRPRELQLSQLAWEKWKTKKRQFLSAQAKLEAVKKRPLEEEKEN